MNNHMYEHAATQENLDLLRARGANDRGSRHRAPGVTRRVGVGRPSRAACILETVEGLLGKAGGPMDGLRVP